MQKLLLVDDDDEEFELFSNAVKEIRKDLEVIHLDGCTDLVSVLKLQQPDMIFLDINMPTVDGIDCLKIIRSIPAYGHIPVLMYSTSNNKLSIQQSFDNKANLYVVKSYSYQGLLQVLEKVFRIDWDRKQEIERKDFVIADETV